MDVWFFVSDLHGSLTRYHKLFQLILEEKPAVVLLGGDLLPAGYFYPQTQPGKDFICTVLQNGFAGLKEKLAASYPKVLLILGNDDPRSEEAELMEGEALGLWSYIHFRKVECADFVVYGYACVPPTPFMLKDWERYDISAFVDPGCISPEQGWTSVPIPAQQLKYATIQADLETLVDDSDLSKAVFLFHAPPYQTSLDRLAVDGKKIEHAPLDKHAGSIAIYRFIKKRQPLISLHGHIHESARLTAAWRQQIGRTWAFSAAHDGPELALIRFDPSKPEQATRGLV
jgi:Icc-related predicted phosphoesterase